jgi:hypothetical protein
MGAPAQANEAWSTTTARRRVRVLAVLGLLPLLGAADCVALLGEGSACAARCDVEDTCGLRSEADCLAASCDPVTGEPLSAEANACLAAAEDCAAAAACACSAGCARVDACADAGAPDESCASSCETLVSQEPTATYLENRCRIEAAECSQLATCSSVSG